MENIDQFIDWLGVENILTLEEIPKIDCSWIR